MQEGRDSTLDDERRGGIRQDHTPIARLEAICLTEGDDIGAISRGRSDGTDLPLGDATED